MNYYYRNGNYHKKFDKSLHDKYDAIGKQFVIDLFRSKGMTAAINDVKADGSIDFQATDLAVLKGKVVICYCELEFKRRWHVTDGVNVLGRKIKHAYHGAPTLYFYIKPELDEFVVVAGSKVVQAVMNGYGAEQTGLYLHDVTTAMVGVPEQMARISYEHCLHYKLTDGKWKNVVTGLCF